VISAALSTCYLGPQRIVLCVAPSLAPLGCSSRRICPIQNIVLCSAATTRQRRVSSASASAARAPTPNCAGQRHRRPALRLHLFVVAPRSPSESFPPAMRPTWRAARTERLLAAKPTQQPPGTCARHRLTPAANTSSASIGKVQPLDANVEPPRPGVPTSLCREPKRACWPPTKADVLNDQATDDGSIYRRPRTTPQRQRVAESVLWLEAPSELRVRALAQRPLPAPTPPREEPRENARPRNGVGAPSRPITKTMASPHSYHHDPAPDPSHSSSCPVVLQCLLGNTHASTVGPADQCWRFAHRTRAPRQVHEDHSVRVSARAAASSVASGHRLHAAAPPTRFQLVFHAIKGRVPIHPHRAPASPHPPPQTRCAPDAARFPQRGSADTHRSRAPWLLRHLHNHADPSTGAWRVEMLPRRDHRVRIPMTAAARQSAAQRKLRPFSHRPCFIPPGDERAGHLGDNRPHVAVKPLILSGSGSSLPRAPAKISFVLHQTH
jgi:hypothetical protein